MFSKGKEKKRKEKNGKERKGKERSHFMAKIRTYCFISCV